MPKFQFTLADMFFAMTLMALLLGQLYLAHNPMALAALVVGVIALVAIIVSRPQRTQAGRVGGPVRVLLVGLAFVDGLVWLFLRAH
ncbi:MAG TPA: hypothetical protein EYP56_04915 [Planctomycetaceae bacterium]|nr:hypothetical protein [Planctomycetaceae bacterium]HIQ23223.1 hypothetical protein [Planctomycetota bacterium]